MINTEREEQFSRCLAIIEELFADENYTIEAQPHEEKFPSVGHIKIEAEELIINDPSLFMEAIKLAPEYEFSPSEDGCTCLTFHFYGMTTKLEEKLKEKFSSYKIISKVLGEFGDQFEILTPPDENRKANLQHICGRVDKLLQEKEAYSFECSVDAETRNIWISIELTDLCVDETVAPKENCVFSELAENAFTVKIESKDAERVSFSFEFPGVWIESD